MSKHGSSTASARIDDKRSRLQKWLMQEDWKIGEAHHENASWIISATNPNGFTLLVIQPQAIADRIDIQASITIGEDIQKRIAGMERTQRQNLLWELRFNLLKMGVDFMGFEDLPKLLHLRQRMYDDGLTKDGFLRLVSLIRDAQNLTIWSLRRAFDQPPDDEVLDSGFVQ